MPVPSPILVICAGNLCRSPFAAACIARGFEAAGMEMDVFSRGLLALPNQRPPVVAQQVAREFGIDLSRHTSQPLLGADLDRAGLILVMSQRQRRRVSELRPACIGKVFLLSQPTRGRPIKDPMGGSEAVFHRVFMDITIQVDAWLQRFGLLKE